MSVSKPIRKLCLSLLLACSLSVCGYARARADTATFDTTSGYTVVLPSPGAGLHYVISSYSVTNLLSGAKSCVWVNDGGTLIPPFFSVPGFGLATGGPFSTANGKGLALAISGGPTHLKGTITYTIQ